MGPKSGPQKVSTFKIFVSSLPNGLKNEDVGKLFEPYGRVVESEVFKGNFAFVHMEDDCNGRKAIEELNGKDMNGNVLSVVQSKNTQGPKIPTMKLAVKNIPESVNAGDLRNLFTKYGYVLEAEIRGQQGHVLLEATGDIRSAINEVNGHEIQGQALKVEAVTNYVKESNSSTSSLKVKNQKRKEPMQGPYGRNHGPPPHPGFMPPPGNFGPFPRRPGPPPMPPRMGMRPGPGPRPYFRPPPPPQEFSQDYDCYDQEGPSDQFYRQPDNYQGYEDEPYFEPPPARHPQSPRVGPQQPPMVRPPQPPFMKNNYDASYEHYENDNQPYFNGKGRGPPPPSMRIPRDRPGPRPPPPQPHIEPSYSDDYYPDNPYSAPDRLTTDYGDYEHQHPPPNAFRPPGNRPPPPLMGNAGMQPPEPRLQALLKRTAKVTKYGKILVNGVDTQPKKKRVGVQPKTKRKINTLPSLMDPIPGTVTPALGHPQNSNLHAGPPPHRPQPRHSVPPLMGANSNPQPPRPLMQFRQLRPTTPRLPGAAPMRTAVRPPRPQVGNGNSNKSLLALYHESKRHPQPPQQMHLLVPTKAALKQEIDFTADVELY